MQTFLTFCAFRQDQQPRRPLIQPADKPRHQRNPLLPVVPDQIVSQGVRIMSTARMNRQSGLACPPRPARGPQKGCVPAREQELLGTSPSQATAPVTSDRNAPANCCLHGRRLTIGRPVEISPALPGSWTSAAPRRSTCSTVRPERAFSTFSSYALITPTPSGQR